MWRPLLLAHGQWRASVRGGQGVLVTELPLWQERESMSFPESRGVSEAAKQEAEDQVYLAAPRVQSSHEEPQAPAKHLVGTRSPF